jgi:hypothetical protein
MNYWYNMITLVIILNCNQSLSKELHKEIQKNGNTEETHNSNSTKIRIFVCTCINTQKESLSITSGKKRPSVDLKSMYFYKICHNRKAVGLLTIFN